jgi:hypothetical protein
MIERSYACVTQSSRRQIKFEEASTLAHERSAPVVSYLQVVGEWQHVSVNDCDLVPNERDRSFGFSHLTFHRPSHLPTFNLPSIE